MLNKNFCSSPWFHIKIASDGKFNSCRWAINENINQSLQTHSIKDFYNSETMCQIRKDFLDGKSLTQCKACYYEESFEKLNGRQRQLLKSAITVNNFELSFRSSPHYNNFVYSYENIGLANLSPVDLQIDLGNTCNSSCIMCNPKSSSRLEIEYKKLNKLQPKIFPLYDNIKSWSKDASLLQKFIDNLLDIPNLKYIHFIGGETLFEESFYLICEALIQAGLSKNIIVGTTTNGTIYSKKLETLIENFKEFHLGISIESVTSLNDYIRFPSEINSVLENIDKFLLLRNINSNLYVSLRITPNVFSIFEIDKLFVYMIENNVIAESCNILTDPKQLQIELIPTDLRDVIKDKIKNVIDYYELESSNIINVRRNDLISSVIANVVLDYYKFICEYKEVDNVDELRGELVKFIKAFEAVHKNSILDYLPEYGKFLRHYGY